MEYSGATPLDHVTALRFGDPYARPASTPDDAVRSRSSFTSLADRMHRQPAVLRELTAFWRDRNALRLLHLVQNQMAADLFDPNRTEMLVSFVAAGGVDVVAEVLLDDTLHEWIPPVQLGALLETLVRVLAELVIVNSSFAWYLFLGHRRLLTRLVDFVSVPCLRDHVLSLLEHALAVVGPAVDIGTFPRLCEAIDTAGDVTFACLTRVLALLIVVSMSSDFRRDKEPYPQCLTQMSTTEELIDRNTRRLLGAPGLVKRLLELLDYRPSDARFRMQPQGGGNAYDVTVTAMAPGQDPQQAAQAAMGTGAGTPIVLPVGDQTDPSLMAAVQGLLQQVSGGAAPAGGDLASLQQWLAQGLTEHLGGAAAAAHGGHGDSDGESTGSYETVEEGEEGEEGTNGAQTPAASSAAAAAAAAAAEALQAAMEPPPSTGDSADCSWFMHRITGTEAWRLRRIALDGGSERTVPDRMHRALSQLPHRPRGSDSAIICGAQSEALFVLNSLLCTPYHRGVWRKMQDAGIMRRLEGAFGSVFARGTRRGRRAQRAAERRDAPEDDPDAEAADPAAPVEIPEAIDGVVRDGPEDDAASTESEGEPDEDHTHDADTLCKIEFLRLLHEFWDAHDVDECVRFVSKDGHEGHRRTLMGRLAQQLIGSKDDVCVDNLICYTLEACIRSHWFTDRPAAQAVLARKLLVPLVQRLMPHQAPETAPPIAHARRLESTFTLLAETCKYHPANWAALDAILVRAGCVTTFRRKMLRYTFQSNFFVRAVVLSSTPALRCAEALQIGTPVLRRRAAAAASADSAADDQRSVEMYESQLTSLSRLFYVRDAVAALPPLPVPAEDIFRVMARGPSALPPSERSVEWFAEGVRCCPAGLTDDEVVDAALDAAPEVTPTDASGSMPTVLRLYEEHEETILRNLMMNLVADEVEATERLCVVTTAIVCLMRHLVRGEAALRAVLGRVVERHEAMSAKERRPPQCPAPAGPTDDEDDDDALLSHERFETECPPGCRHCDKSKKPAPVQDVVWNFFNMLCAWVGHYACQERYFHTLFFCTQIDVPQWRAAAATLLRVLPDFFLPGSRPVPVAVPTLAAVQGDFLPRSQAEQLFAPHRAACAAPHQNYA